MKSAPTDHAMESIVCLAPDGYAGHGGIAQYVRDVVDSLVEISPRTNIVLLSRNPGAADASHPDVDQHHANGSRLGLTYRALKMTWCAAPRFIVCFHANLLPIAALIAKRHAIPVLLFTYGVDVWKPNRWVPGRLWRLPALTATISRYTRTKLIQDHGVPPHRIRLLPNCVGLQRPDIDQSLLESLTARYGLAGKKVLLTVGRLSSRERYKGHDRVIRVLSAVRRSVPNAHYLVVGGGDDQQRLQAMATRYDVAESVQFIGTVDSPQREALYTLADCFAMPSTDEGFGFVFLEALRAGLNVVALDAAGTKDALAHANPQQMVPPGDDDALAAALIATLRGNDRRACKSRSLATIRAFARQRFAHHLSQLVIELEHTPC